MNINLTAAAEDEKVGHYYYYSLLLAHSPVNRSGSPHGLSQVKFRTQVKNNTKHAQHTNAKHTNTIRKVVSPFGIALVD